MAVRALPQQREWMIFREVRVPHGINRYPLTYVEQIRMPQKDDPQEYSTHPVDQVQLGQDVYVGVLFTEDGRPNWFDPSVGRIIRRNWMDDEFKPRPITAFLQTVYPRPGLLRLSFFPRKIEGWRPEIPVMGGEFAADPATAPATVPAHSWRFDVGHTGPQRFIGAHPGEQFRVLQGAYRPLLYNIPWESIGSRPELLAFYMLEDPDLFHDEPVAYNAAERALPAHLLPLRLPPDHLKHDAIAWDETIGRILLANPGIARVEVFDFAKCPKEGK